MITSTNNITPPSENRCNPVEPKKTSMNKMGSFQKEKVKALIEAIKSKQESILSQRSSQESERKSKLHLDLKSLKNIGASYGNRFKAQKNMIEMQKIRLQEQEKLINELKMGILAEETKSSIDKNRNQIRELFADYKMKALGKIPLELISNDERSTFCVKTQSAPKIIQELEQRAMERMKYREMIKARKKILEETKRKMQEEALEQKKCLEEDEKKRHLEMIKERRRQYLEKMKVQQEYKERFLRNYEKAVKFYERKLVTNAFSRWKFEYKLSLEKVEMSENYCNTRIVGKSFKALRSLVEIKNGLKFNIAMAFYRNSLLRRAFRCFEQNLIEGVRSMQVAEDFYDFHLQIKCMKHWHRYICKEKILMDIKTQRAIHHHMNKLLFQLFFQWKSLPAVLKLEKAKEERKQKWRLKVWEILPDFSPTEI